MTITLEAVVSEVSRAYTEQPKSNKFFIAKRLIQVTFGRAAFGTLEWNKNLADETTIGPEIKKIWSRAMCFGAAVDLIFRYNTPTANEIVDDE